MISRVRGMGRIRRAVNDLRTTETELRRRLWQRWHSSEGKSRPVFLIGCGRSGTSMIVRHLSRPWRTELYNEDNPAAFERWRLRDLSIVEELIARSQAQLVLFKPILDTYQTQVLLSRFPNAKFIFVFRHYDDVINSSLKRFGHQNRIRHVNNWINDDFGEFRKVPPPEKTKALIRSLWKPSLNQEAGGALYWLFQNRLFYDLELDQNERVKLVRYESVVSNPDEEFKSLCRFLNLEFEPQITDGIFLSSIKRSAPPEFDPEIRAACEGLWLDLCRQVGVEE